jgi:hypothetical protein
LYCYDEGKDADTKTNKASGVVSDTDKIKARHEKKKRSGVVSDTDKHGQLQTCNSTRFNLAM